MTRITADTAQMGKSCPYCRFPIKSGTEVEQCDACSTIHHVDCWEEGEGCAVMGCENNPASRAKAAESTGPTQAPPQGKKVVTEPIVATTQAVTTSSNSNGLLIGLVALVGVLVGTVLVLAISKSGGSDTPASAAADPSAEEAEPAESSGPSASEERGAQRDVVTTLRRYEDAYTNQEPERLRSVFTNGVSRFGNVSGSCSWTYGISDVIDAAASNMNGDSYELVGLSQGDVNLIGSERLTKATVNGKYSFGGGQPAKIRFVLVPKGGGWRVNKVDAFCGSHQPY